MGVLRLLVFTILGTAALSLAMPENPASTVLGTYVPLLALLLGCAWLARRGHVRAAALGVTTLVFVLVTVVIVAFGGLMANNAVAYILGMMIAGATLGTRAAVIFAALASATAGGVVLLELNGVLPESLAPVAIGNAWIAITVTLVLAALIHRMSIRGLDRSLQASEEARVALVEAQRQSEIRARLGQVLAGLAERALSHQDEATFCRETAETVMSALGVDRVLMLEADDDGRQTLAVGAGFTPRAAPGQALGAALDALAANPAAAHDQPPLAALLATLGADGMASGTIVGIRGKARLRGLMAVLGHARRGAIGPLERPFLDTVALMVGGFLERQRARERAERSQKLEVVGRLANGVAHDFNNLLLVMVGVSQELRLLHPDATTRRALGELDAACQHGALLTRQLLAFSRRKTQQDVDLDAASLVNELTPILRRLIGDDVRFVVALPRDACVVRADRGHLEQVLLNLVVNAREAMPEGGTVTVTVVSEPERVRIEVTDTGLGMDAATRERIFQPFFTTKATGTGLGLATVWDIVDRLGGSIDVRSEPGRGSTFDVRLPRVPAPMSVAVAASPEAPAPHPGRAILLAEDHELVRASAARMLRRAGHSVTAVANGREALALIEAGQRFDAIVSDVAMPELGGLRLLTLLDEGGHHVPTVLVSGHAEGLPALSPRMAGRVRFLSKPFDQDGLLGSVDAVIAAAARADAQAAGGAPSAA